MRIEAQALREQEGLARPVATIGFAMPADEAFGPSIGKRLKGHWRQADVKRAIAAAQKAGLVSYRVEIAPDGTISLVVGGSPEAEA